MAKMNQGRDNHRNKLSRVYKFKKRTGKIVKQKDKDDGESLIKKARIIIRNLSFKTTEKNIEQLYGPFGQIEEIKLLKRPDGTLVGCGFVQFKNINDASKAIFKTNKTEFLGRTISCEWSIPKSQFVENLKKAQTNEDIVDDNTKDLRENNNLPKSKTKSWKKNEISKAELRKMQKLKKRKKRARIIIRNLPFTVTEDSIRENFLKYGTIEEVTALKKPDGTWTGCCFLQYERVQSAAQAMHYENGRTFEGRTMVVDWALPKDKFQKSNESNSNSEVKEESDVEVMSEKKEESKVNAVDEIHIKEENLSDEGDMKEEISSLRDDEENDDSDGDNDPLSSSDDDHDDSVDDKDKVKLELDEKSETLHPRRVSNDVSEGKTVFIKNVPFSATNDDLKECMQQFGPVYYALICIDQLTEHSKGTAFVKFRNVEDAEKCLAAGTELKLHDQILDPHKALHRNEVKMKAEEKKKVVKDSRNLYLVKEGVILAASAAAQDVSAADMARRLQLEQWKSQMLRNLNMFVSRVRLVIHNLPESTDDAKLRQLFKNHSSSKAVITEARVMRDLKNVDANKVGKSKEYGFVSFTTHEDALQALRSLNNNPNIFSKAKRPIVAFSIENRVMVNAKKRRIEKSRQNNPIYTNRKRQEGGKEEVASGDVKGSKEGAKRRKPMDRKLGKGKKKRVEEKDAGGEEVGAKAFVGTAGKAGVTRMNGKFFLKKQAKLHIERIKERKKQTKSARQFTMRKKEEALNKREAKPRQGSRRPSTDEINFNRIVKNYKSELSSTAKPKTKWYEA